ncbi:hypothetical protein GGR16_003514 [Chelatococcus caeni]|uniref:Uncharacterized protein n=1 Tax=Chelatococcus caeni TaxID=1348468 RepID=A0A840C809_9HYPH|nr:hypothetical protein [Chelatococcus caeni]MBB4018467.1 hypothetical protein [Chelatococcus caeni]
MNAALGILHLKKAGGAFAVKWRGVHGGRFPAHEHRLAVPTADLARLAGPADRADMEAVHHVRHEAGLVIVLGIGVDAIPVTLADARQLQRLEPLGGAPPGPQQDAQADIAFQREACSEALVAAR